MDKFSVAMDDIRGQVARRVGDPSPSLHSSTRLDQLLLHTRNLCSKGAQGVRPKDLRCHRAYLTGRRQTINRKNKLFSDSVIFKFLKLLKKKDSCLIQNKGGKIPQL